MTAPRSPATAPTSSVRGRLSARKFSEHGRRIELGCPGPRVPAILTWRPNRNLSGEGYGAGLVTKLRSQGELRFSSCCVIGFLRGQPINLGTPPGTSHCPVETRSPPDNAAVRWQTGVLYPPHAVRDSPTPGRFTNARRPATPRRAGPRPAGARPDRPALAGGEGPAGRRR